jgi:ATP-binding cassette subfamily C protein
VGFVLVRNDLTTVGAVTAAALYFLRLFGPIGGLLFTFDQFQAVGVSLTRLAGVVLMPRPAVSHPSSVAERGDVMLTGIVHEYTAGKPVLREVTVRLSAGERVALVGASGAGKTTLGAIAAGVIRPTGGTVTVAGIPKDLSDPVSRAGIYLVSQEVHVFAGTVREQLTLARPDASDEQVQAALEAVSAHRDVAALPDGLDTVLGDHGHQLNPAQAQHLALARILVKDPWFVVLDEATAEAGSSGARELEAAALAAVRGRTALIVAHRLTQARTADRILVIDCGVIVEAGGHDELLAQGGRYAELWQAWSGGDLD